MVDVVWCPVCETELLKTDTFCPSCGFPVSGGSEGSSGTAAVNRKDNRNAQKPSRRTYFAYEVETLETYTEADGQQRQGTSDIDGIDKRAEKPKFEEPVFEDSPTKTVVSKRQWSTKFIEHDDLAGAETNDSDYASQPSVVSERHRPTTFVKSDDASSATTFVSDEDVESKPKALVVTLKRISSGEVFCAIPPCVVGRGECADCKITGNTDISRKHMEMAFSTDSEGTPQVWVVDCSLNGVRINGRRIQKGLSTKLENGDRLEIATESFLVQID